MFSSEVVGRRNVNVALRRPASQQNTFNGLSASLAVDGNYGNIATTQASTPNAWWAVDLGAPSYVRGINLTNVPQSGIG
jgi:hypothetical protein